MAALEELSLRPSPASSALRLPRPLLREGEARFRSYNRWLQEKFGERVYKVIVDAGFTCPNRDGTVAVGGCAYCNNNSFRPPSAIKTDPIRDQVREGIEYIRKRFDAHKFIIYFQPFTNTYAETGYLRELYTDAVEHPEVVGLAIGTRPDCVDEEKIRMIDEIAQRTFVSLEFGVESIYDDTLRRVNRGHDYATFLRAMELTRRRSIHIGAHLILGFPWETREQWLAMADEMSRAGVDALKIHHLHLVRGTALAAEYARRPFRVLGYEEYLDRLCGRYGHDRRLSLRVESGPSRPDTFSRAAVSAPRPLEDSQKPRLGRHIPPAAMRMSAGLR